MAGDSWDLPWALLCQAAAAAAVGEGLALYSGLSWEAAVTVALFAGAAVAAAVSAVFPRAFPHDEAQARLGAHMIGAECVYAYVGSGFLIAWADALGAFVLVAIAPMSTFLLYRLFVRAAAPADPPADPPAAAPGLPRGAAWLLPLPAALAALNGFYFGPGPAAARAAVAVLCADCAAEAGLFLLRRTALSPGHHRADPAAVQQLFRAAFALAAIVCVYPLFSRNLAVVAAFVVAAVAGRRRRG